MWLSWLKAESRKLIQLPPIHLWEHLKIRFTVLKTVSYLFLGINFTAKPITESTRSSEGALQNSAWFMKLILEMVLGKRAMSKALIQEPQVPTGSQAPPFALDCVKASWGCAKQPTCYRPHLTAKPTSHTQIEKGSILSTPSVLNHCVKQVPSSPRLLSQPAYFFMKSYGSFCVCRSNK